MSFPNYLLEKMIPNDAVTIILGGSLYIDIYNIIADLEIKSTPRVKIFINDIECNNPIFSPSKGKIPMNGKIFLACVKPNFVIAGKSYKFKVIIDTFNILTLEFERTVYEK